MGAGAAFWLTGLPGSGKTTLALAAKEYIPGLVVLHMDEMRKIVTPVPTYSGEEREHVYMALVFAAVVLTREGHNVVIDATANLRKWRDEARARIKGFHEIYIKCPLELCMEREKSRMDRLAPRDIYKKGEAGAPVPGVNVPYEEPLDPELMIDCGRLGREEAALVLSSYISSIILALSAQA